jgi:hypothetical protein
VRVPRLGLERRLRQLRPVEPAAAVHVGRRLERPAQRPRRARGDRHPGHTRERADAQGVLRHRRELAVAADRRDRAQIGVGIARREEDREGVVVPGVAVQHDRGRHRRSLSDPAVSAARASARCSS